MEKIYLPTLHWFAMKNPFTGSFENFRYRVVPKVTMATAKEVDFDAIPPETEIEQTEVTEPPTDVITEEVESGTGG